MGIRVPEGLRNGSQLIRAEYLGLGKLRCATSVMVTCHTKPSRKSWPIRDASVVLMCTASWECVVGTWLFAHPRMCRAPQRGSEEPWLHQRVGGSGSQGWLNRTLLHEGPHWDPGPTCPEHVQQQRQITLIPLWKGTSAPQQGLPDSL